MEICKRFFFIVVAFFHLEAVVFKSGNVLYVLSFREFVTLHTSFLLYGVEVGDLFLLFAPLLLM